MVITIRFDRFGDPEVLEKQEIALPAPGRGEVLLRHTAIGLNFFDIYQRSGLYPLPLPSGLGAEAAGVIEALGNGVDSFAVGDRVAYCTAPVGAYSEARLIPAACLIKLPAAIDDQTAAAMMLKGLTAHYLLRRTYRISAGETILFHAAAGGVGLIACQWASHLGATVIGTVGSRQKAELARAHGCNHPILYREEDFTRRLRALTEGAGVPVVYDSIGKDTFEKSLDCLRPFGLMVSFGNASGVVPPVPVGLLADKGSLYLTRPSLFTHAQEPGYLAGAAAELFDLVSRGIIKIEVNQTYSLGDIAQAHRDLEARKTTGSTVILP